MKKIVFFSVLVALSLWALVYVNSVKEKKRIEAEKVTVIESQAASSLPQAETSSSQSSAAIAPDYRLKVLTEPEGAEIYMDADKVGQAPLELLVPNETKKMRLVLAGYEDYERQVPAAKDSEGDLVWKIQLRKSNPEVPLSFYSKDISPFSVQIKAVPLAEFSEYQKDYEGLQPKFCRVKIKDALWVRVLTGPYSNKKKANEALAEIKTKYVDAFISTKHKCLKDGEVQ